MIDLNEVAKDWGYDDDIAMLEDFITDSLVAGVCKVCKFSTEVEPDQERGWCEDCGTTTVVSVMVLAGVI